MNKFYFKVAVSIGILIRIFLACTTYHPDIRALALGGDLISNGNILNLYDYLRLLPKDNPLITIFGTGLFIYPPLIYLLQGIFLFIGNLLFPIFHLFTYSPQNYFGNIYYNLYLLILKIPNIIFDLASGLVFYNLFQNEKSKRTCLLLWLFNPVTLYTAYMMGQFDIIPTFFVILSLYFVNKNKLEYSALSLGFGIAYKIYPLFLIPLLLLLSKSYSKKFKLLLLSVLPYFISVLPYIHSSGFRSSALLAGQTLKSFYAQLPISGSESIILFIFFLGLFYLISINSDITTKNIWRYFSIPLILFFIFTHYHPQWFLWMTPFLIIYYIEYKAKLMLSIIIMIVSYFGLLFFFDSSLTVNIFAPLIPSLSNLPTLWEILHINIDFNFSRSILQTLFASSAVYICYISFKYKSNE